MKISRLLALVLVAGSAHAGDCSQPAATPPAAPTHGFYYNPWADLMRMQAMMNSQLNALNTMPMFIPAPAYAPEVQASTLQRTPEGYRLDVPLSGFKAEDIKVRLEGELLTISAQTSSSTKEEKRHELSQRSFAESLTLPGPVQASEMKQSFKDGVLTITLPARPAGSI